MPSLKPLPSTSQARDAIKPPGSVDPALLNCIVCPTSGALRLSWALTVASGGSAGSVPAVTAMSAIGGPLTVTDSVTMGESVPLLSRTRRRMVWFPPVAKLVVNTAPASVNPPPSTDHSYSAIDPSGSLEPVLSQVTVAFGLTVSVHAITAVGAWLAGGVTTTLMDRTLVAVWTSPSTASVSVTRSATDIGPAES